MARAGTAAARTAPARTARTTAPRPARAAPPARAPRRAPQPVPRRRTPSRAPVRGRRRQSSRLARLAAIPHSPFVDRLITGRAWIVLVGGLLAGIVFLNVALLELNAGIARTTEKVAAVKRENARLRLQAARLGSTERIQQAAADLGLVLPVPGEVRYLKANPARDAPRALALMSAPEEAAPVAAPVEAVAEPLPVAEAPQEAPPVAEVVPEQAPGAAVPQAAAPPPPGATG